MSNKSLVVILSLFIGFFAYCGYTQWTMKNYSEEYCSNTFGMSINSEKIKKYKNYGANRLDIIEGKTPNIKMISIYFVAYPPQNRYVCNLFFENDSVKSSSLNFLD